MTVKMTGLEYKAFINDDVDWPPEGELCNEIVTVDEVEFDTESGDENSIVDEAEVIISDGFINLPHNKSILYTTFIRRWLEARATATFLVECPKDRADEVRAAVKAAGGTVRG